MPDTTDNAKLEEEHIESVASIRKRLQEMAVDEKHLLLRTDRECARQADIALASANALNERLMGFVRRICKADPDTVVFKFVQESARALIADIEGKQK